MKLKPIKSPENPEERIFNLICNYADTFRNQNEEEYVIINYKNDKELAFLSDVSAIENRIREICFNELDKIVKKTCVDSIYKTILMQANRTTDVVPTVRRCYFDGDQLIYNLNCDYAMLINETICRPLNKNNFDFKVNFYENDGFQNQVKPIFKNSETLPEMLAKLMNVSGDDLLLLSVYIVSLLFDNISHPILIFNGEHGACKSTAMRMICKIIDPDSKELLALPEKKDDLINTLYNGYFITFDNVSVIKNDISDILCKAVTGSSINKRKLYTDNDEIVLNIKRPIGINGISIDMSQSDLIDRSIIIDFKRLSCNKRMTDAQVFGLFNELLPNILGEIFTLIKKVLKIKNSISVEHLPRMADFAHLGYCIAEAMNEGDGTRFLEVYSNNNLKAVENTLQNSSLITSILEFMNEIEEWKGSATELLQELLNLFSVGSVPGDFPATTNSLSRALSKYKHDLSKLGVDVTIGRAKDRYIMLKNMKGANQNV
ncbi:hypothetical protein IJE86_10965 [bacterium]|nr:hypothetical protein [bacterium]